MEKMVLDKLDAIACIREFLASCYTNDSFIRDYEYHHNTRYEYTSDIIRQGILSTQARYDLEGKQIPDDEKYRLSDDAYPTGIDGVSLSKTGLTDLYRDEFEYDPTDPNCIDILISKDVKANRKTNNYGNEFIAKYKISPEQFCSIDIRILKLIDNALKRDKLDENIIDIIKKYNCLRNISKSMLESNLDIPLREASSGIITLDKEKMIECNEIILK